MAAYNTDTEARHFNKVAETYEASFGLNTSAAARKVERLCDVFAPWLGAAPQGPVLELGAGTGFLTRHLAPRFAHRDYIASDLTPAMLEIAAKTYTDGKAVTWQEEDCTKLHFQDSSISGATGHGILHHVPLESTIMEMARVLKPGGRIAFYEPNLLNPYVFLVKKIPFMRPEGDSEGETALIGYRLRKLLRKHGFVDIHVVPCEFTMNQTPEKLAPLVEKVSRGLERIPLLREFGGSLKIMACRS